MIDSLVAFAVGLFVGAAGIYVGARAVLGVDDYTYALVTALLATLAWIGVASVLWWIPFLGPLVGLVAYVALLGHGYPGGWIDAVGIATVAWVAALLVLYVLSVLRLTSLAAIGVAAA